MCNPSLSELPAFLVNEGGLNSGFMIAHCTAAALGSCEKHEITCNLLLNYSNFNEIMITLFTKQALILNITLQSAFFNKRSNVTNL